MALPRYTDLRPLLSKAGMKKKNNTKMNIEGLHGFLLLPKKSLDKDALT